VVAAFAAFAQQCGFAVDPGRARTGSDKDKVERTDAAFPSHSLVSLSSCLTGLCCSQPASSRVLFSAHPADVTPVFGPVIRTDR